MTKFPVRWIGFAAIIFAYASVGHAADQAPEVVTLGDNTYSVTVSATHKFTRNTDKLKTEATAAASAFCAQQGKQLKIVSVKDNKSMFLVGDMASATIVFKALALSDPALSRSAPSPTVEAQAPAAGSTNETLYANLLRLDDLHKKGILTDEEFAAAKKKELERGP